MLCCLAAASEADDATEFKVDVAQPGVGDGVKYGINIPKEYLERLWVDPDFPPTHVSLGLAKEKALSVAGRLVNHAWCPISYSKPDLPLFAGTIDPTSLGQGALGDCWLITAISTMAEYPESLKQLFLTKKHNEIGQYVLRLYDAEDGEWLDVKVDSLVPIDLGGGMAYEGKPLVYVNPTKQEVWMCVLEKAVAKLFGSYAQLNGGLVGTGWTAMTGCTDIQNYEGNGETFKKLRSGFDLQLLDAEWDKQREKEHALMNAEEFFKLLDEFDGRHFLMCCGIIAKKNPNLKENVDDEGSDLLLVSRGMRKFEPCIFCEGLYKGVPHSPIPSLLSNSKVRAPGRTASTPSTPMRSWEPMRAMGCS